MDESSGIRPKSIEETTIEQIMFIKQRVAVFGANDSEPSELDRLVREVREGKISPIDALHLAETIESSKNDRH